MDSIKQTYRKFLQINFGGMKLHRPLFYNCEWGLRFNLQDEHVMQKSDNGLSDNDEYFATVVKRACTLFESVFEPTDRLLIVAKDARGERSRFRKSNYLFKQFAGLRKEGIDFSIEKGLYLPDDRYNVALITTDTMHINYKNMLTAVGNADFSQRQPRFDRRGMFTSKEIYFLHLEKRLIFLMYDDRGLDIVAADKETLRPIYERFNDWILDYDRAQIDDQFT